LRLCGGACPAVRAAALVAGETHPQVAERQRDQSACQNSGVVGLTAASDLSHRHQTPESTGECSDKKLVVPIVYRRGIFLWPPLAANELQHLVDRVADLSKV
jgi:hypothetical protein